MDAWKQIFDKWPRASIYLLIAYVILYSAFTAYETYRKNTYEAERTFVQAIFDQCSVASDMVARIATATSSSPELGHEIERFWTLYYGKLVIVENNAVANAMKSFGNKLREHPALGERDLLEKALTVGGACRDLIKASWGLSMAPWKDLQANHEAVCNNPKC
jgi:hypothetical protein